MSRPARPSGTTLAGGQNRLPVRRAVARDGRRDDKLSVRDLRTGKVSLRTDAGRHVIDDIAISPDGKLLATGHPNGFVCLRDPATGAVRKEWQAHEAGPGDVGRVVRAGGIWLASAGDRTVKVWDPLTGQGAPQVRRAHEPGLRGAVRGDGRTVLSYSIDLTGYVWDVRPKLGPRMPDHRRVWSDLNGEPEAAFRAVWLAAADPKAPRCSARSCPSPSKPDAERFKKLVPELAGDDFAMREAADKELAKFGPAAFALARKSRADSDSPEVRTRLDRVMKGWTEGAFAPEVSQSQEREVVAMGTGRHRQGAEAPRPLGS